MTKRPLSTPIDTYSVTSSALHTTTRHHPRPYTNTTTTSPTHTNTPYCLANESYGEAYVKAPQLRMRSTKQAPIQPSTLRMRLAFLRVVTCSTSSA